MKMDNGNRQFGYHYTESGLDNVWLANGYEFHETTYGRGVSINNVDGLHKAIGLGLVERKDRLTGREIRFLRHELDWSQNALAQFLGTTEQTLARWEKDQVSIPGPAQRLLAGLYREHVTGNADLQASVERIAKLDAELHADLRLQLDDDAWELCA
jgi:putative transcriptional regulator